MNTPLSYVNKSNRDVKLNRPQLVMFNILAILFCFSLTATAQIYTVNTTDDTDDGKCNALHCSLREAMNELNLTSGQIHFDIPSSGPFVITPRDPLPPLTNDNISIDATTQVDWSPGYITINGSVLKNCLQIEGSKVEIYGLKIENCFEAAILVNAPDNAMQNNIKIGRSGKENIFVNSEFGFLAKTKNLSDVTIQSNYIGTDQHYSSGLGNEYGIVIAGEDVASIKIGGSSVMGDGNKIMDSSKEALVITQHTEVYGNVIGGSIPNKSTGIFILGSLNQIGGGSFELQNEIVNNNGYGIIIDKIDAIKNTLSYNTIYCNASGAFLNNGNDGINPPTITENVHGLLRGTASPNDLIEIYKNESPCFDCQAEHYIGSAVANGSGDWSFNVGYNITSGINASATDSDGNTSAFSACSNSDDCIDAFTMNINTNVCSSAFTVFNTETASSSIDPLYDCSAFTSQGNATDIWIKAEVPSTGAVMLKFHKDYSWIDPMVEVYTGDCSSLKFEKCDSLFRAPYQFPVAELVPGEFVYFRVFDQYDFNSGHVALNLIELPSDTADWIICSEDNTFRAANDFIVQYEPGTSPGEVQAVTNDLVAQGLNLVGECECVDKPLQLWQGITPVEAETGGRFARNRPDVDTVNYNFIIEDQLCITESELTTLIYLPGMQGDEGEIIVIVEPVVSYADCTPVGLIEALGPAYVSTVSEPKVTLAIIDTGFDENNSVISKAVWNNPAVTDADNCYLNDDSGYDFLNDDADPNDIIGHGTGVAGIVAGGFNNNVDLNMMNLKFSDNEQSTLFPAICAMYYAIDNGSQVMNLSWGFITSESIPTILKDVMDYAFERDVLIVTSAGNSEDNIDDKNKFPANYDKNNLITVGAYMQLAGSNPQRADYSNFGKFNVDLLANGQVETIGLDETIEVLAGTSLAAPLVSRTGAEIRAKYPALSAQDVRDCILSTVDVYASLESECATSGILDQDAALLCAYDKALEFCGESSVTFFGVHQIDTLIVKEMSITSRGLVSDSRDIIYKAGDNILLGPSFSVETGATFLAAIEDCSASVPIH